MDPWTPKFTKADYDPNRVIRFLIKTNLRVICLFTARAVDSEWTHMWPATSVNNDGRTDYLRLSHLAALSSGVNNYLRCIHKGLKAFSRVTPPIQMHDQTSLTCLTQSFDPTYHHLMSAEVGSRSHWIDDMTPQKKKSRVGCLQLTCRSLHIVRNK